MSAKKVIFDTDLGVDDAMALLFLHYSPLIDLVGITTGVGNAPVELTTRNCLYMKQRFGIDAKIYRGAGTALDGSNPLPPPVEIHGADGIGNIDMPPIQLSEESLSACQYIIDAVRAAPNQLTIITVGRLTNLALALQQAPDIARLIKEVIVMGGATGRNGHGGNISPVAEANIYGDPLAADQVFCTPVPLTMVGLDVTHEVIMNEACFLHMKKTCGEVGEFIYQISRVYTQFYRDWVQLDGCYVHDASATIYAVAPELFVREAGQLRVAIDGVATGQTIFSPAGRPWFRDDWKDQPEKHVCVKVDAAGVLDIYQRTINSGANSGDSLLNCPIEDRN